MNIDAPISLTTITIDAPITIGITGPAGPGVATGGTTGQVLAKASATDFDSEWIDANPFNQDLNTTDTVTFTGLGLNDGLTPTALTLTNMDDGAGSSETGFMKWNANVLEIGTEAAGTGTQRNVLFPTPSAQFSAELIAYTFKAGGEFGSFCTISNFGTVVCPEIQVGGSTLQIGSNFIKAGMNNVFAWTDGGFYYNTPDTGISRSSAGVLAVGDGSQGDASGVIAVAATNQRTESTADPSTTEYPNDKDSGVHRNTTSGDIFQCHNYNGTIFKTQLT